MKKTALVVGATGATGRALVELLKSNDAYEKIYLLHYRKTGIPLTSKISEYIFPFDELLDFRSPRVDDVFCCIGTTMKRAGSKAAFEKVDRDYVMELGKWAKIEDVTSFHVISYLGANSKSSVFYNRIKGEMEEGVSKLNLHSLYIYHPPILRAKRDKFRFGEMIGLAFLTILSPIMLGGLKKHRPLAVEKMAASMVNNALHSKKGIHIVSSEEMR